MKRPLFGEFLFQRLQLGTGKGNQKAIAKFIGFQESTLSRLVQSGEQKYSDYEKHLWKYTLPDEVRRGMSPAEADKYRDQIYKAILFLKELSDQIGVDVPLSIPEMAKEFLNKEGYLTHDGYTTEALTRYQQDLENTRKRSADTASESGSFQLMETPRKSLDADTEVEPHIQTTISTQIKIPNTFEKIKVFLTITLEADGEASINTVVDDIERAKPNIFEEERRNIYFTYDVKRSERNADGESPVMKLWLTIYDPTDQDLQDISEITELAKYSYADDQETPIVVQKRT